jgi:UrcA family protein
MIRTFATTAAAFATFAGFAATAHAATQDRAQVRFTDLDLSSPEGQAKLDKRIAVAARTVCSNAYTGSRVKKADGECMARARASIEQQLAARRPGSRIDG